MKPDYGIDAPNVVRNLFLCSLILAALAGFSFLIQNAVWFWIVFLYTFPISLVLLITGCWMLYGIKITKPRTALNMIQNLELTGWIYHCCDLLSRLWRRKKRKALFDGKAYARAEIHRD